MCGERAGLCGEMVRLCGVGDHRFEQHNISSVEASSPSEAKTPFHRQIPSLSIAQQQRISCILQVDSDKRNRSETNNGSITTCNNRLNALDSA